MLDFIGFCLAWRPAFLVLPLLMCVPCACVIPLAPQFEDPPAAQNFAPRIVDTTPIDGELVSTKMFRAVITDPNPADDLYVLWLADFPPFGSNSRQLSSPTFLHSPTGASPQFETTLTVDCFGSNLATGLTQHQIMVAVGDRPFIKPEDQPSTDRKYTSLPADGLRAEAHWTLNLECK